MELKTPEWSVRHAELQKDYTIILDFADGSRRLYDARSLLEEPLFEKLNDIDFFLSGKAEYGSVVWPGDLDVAPEHLYECSKIVG